uniref:Uncharacterized protein n=1 Tax=Anopheles arabiensis TaxID=7173 RepID=A0A182IF97_ANOAR
MPLGLRLLYTPSHPHCSLTWVWCDEGCASFCACPALQSRRFDQRVDALLPDVAAVDVDLRVGEFFFTTT